MEKRLRNLDNFLAERGLNGISANELVKNVDNESIAKSSIKMNSPMGGSISVPYISNNVIANARNRKDNA